MAFNSILEHQGAEPLEETEFKKFALQKMQTVKMDPQFLDRPVNVGFSGGEKKRN
jgi:Fe-S cluster assembly ATP-binding protein